MTSAECRRLSGEWTDSPRDSIVIQPATSGGSIINVRITNKSRNKVNTPFYFVERLSAISRNCRDRKFKLQGNGLFCAHVLPKEKCGFLLPKSSCMTLKMTLLVRGAE